MKLGLPEVKPPAQCDQTARGGASVILSWSSPQPPPQPQGRALPNPAERNSRALLQVYFKSIPSDRGHSGAGWVGSRASVESHRRSLHLPENMSHVPPAHAWPQPPPPLRGCHVRESWGRQDVSWCLRRGTGELLLLGLLLWDKPYARCFISVLCQIFPPSWHLVPHASKVPRG